jgi:dTDP-4-dehydrorhamnose reductase
MKILVTGSEGQLGWELLRQGNKLGFEMFPADLPELDITRSDQVSQLLQRCKPSLIINAAAYTNVDKAETDKEAAFAVNRNGAAVLARQCQIDKIPLIHVSTDFVFDGLKKQPYLENDPIAPIGVYGQSKAAGEEEVRAQLKAHIIVRTAWLYGVHGHNFVKTMLRLAKEREPIRVVDDQYGCPTCAFDLAEALLTIAGRIRDNAEITFGTFHFCGKGIATWFDFTKEIVKIAESYSPIKTTHVIPVTTAEYPTNVARPPYSALDCGLIGKRFGIIPKPWQESLKITVDRIFEENHGI